MKIANIIFEKELVNHVNVEYINYVNSAVEYDKLDKTLPTLYVGWSFMKQSNVNNSFFNNIDILHKKIITNELYWECSFEESKNSHVKGVNYFVDHSPYYYFNSKYNYINLDPIFFQLATIDDLMDVVPKEIDKMYQFKNEMIYILSENKISGINLNIFDFFKFDIKEISEKISLRSKVVNNDVDGSFYQKQYKIFPNFTLLKRYLIVM